MTRSPTRSLSIRDQQQDCEAPSRWLRACVRRLLDKEFGLAQYRLTVYLTSRKRMAELNETHLHHAGPTDVITFDYGESRAAPLHGEILVCPAVAQEQARLFRTTSQSELLRYIIHGILHLQGQDDRTPRMRSRMKREEDRLLAAVSRGALLET